MMVSLIYVVVFCRSVIEVRNGLTFLDLIVIQIEVSLCYFSFFLFDFGYMKLNVLIAAES
jgi:hypothetical protein